MEKAIRILFSFAAMASCVYAAGRDLNRYQLDGLEAPVYYDAPKSILDGDDGTVVMIVIQGWGGRHGNFLQP